MGVQLKMWHERGNRHPLLRARLNSVVLEIKKCQFCQRIHSRNSEKYNYVIIREILEFCEGGIRMTIHSLDINSP